MEQKLYFYPANSSSTLDGGTPEAAAAALNALEVAYDRETAELSLLALSGPNYYSVIVKVLYDGGGYEAVSSAVLTVLNFDGTRQTVTLDAENAARVIGFEVKARVPGGSGGNVIGNTYLESDAVGEFIYPTGELDAKALPVTLIGFKNHQRAEAYTHIRFMVAEILEDGTVGDEGHVWHSQPFEKDIDCSVTLSDLIPICEGKQLANFNVLFEMVAYNPDTAEYDFVESFIVGDATNVTTFSVRSEVVEEVVSFATLDGVLCCLDPCILTVNRYENREIQFVRVEVSNYIADFEFYADRNLLEIDLAEYLQTLFALVDLFEFQKMQTTVVVKLYNSNKEHIETQGLPVTVVYGKKPDPAISGREIRVQWLDKYGLLHDENFKIADNQTEGASKQKYVTNGEEREDKTGEKSITLAKILANNSEREALKTIVFADHVRALIGDTWKRVTVANTYKTGAGREKKNFEITIKRAL